MAVAKIEVTTQQLIDALGIDVYEVVEVVQTPDDRIAGKLTLVVEAKWAKLPMGAPVMCYPLCSLEEVPMRVLAAKE